MSVHETLILTRARLAEKLRPLLDGGVKHTADNIARDAVAAVISELSRDFIITPRKQLMAVIEARETSRDTLETQVILLEMALATARVR